MKGLSNNSVFHLTVLDNRHSLWEEKWTSICWRSSNINEKWVYEVPPDPFLFVFPTVAAQNQWIHTVIPSPLPYGMYVSCMIFNHAFWPVFTCFLSLHGIFGFQLFSETLKARNLHVSESKCSHIISTGGPYGKYCTSRNLTILCYTTSYICFLEH